MRQTTQAFLFSTLLSVCAASSEAAQPSQVVVGPQTSLQDAAVALGHLYDSTYANSDAAGMVSLYAANGEMVSPGGKVINGRAALEAYYRERFAAGATGHKITVLETHVVGDTGYSVADFSVSVPTVGHPSDRHVEQGHIAAVYTHGITGWHFALVQTSVTPAAGQES